MERKKESEIGTIYIPSTAGRSTYRVSLQDRPYPNECSGACVASPACPKGGQGKSAKVRKELIQNMLREF